MEEELEESSAGSNVDASASALHSARSENASGELSPGEVVDGRYVIQRLIARGGMGLVYECTHQRLGKKLALKVIRPDVGQSAQVIRRFLVEAQAASAIGNEHIIDVSDFGELPGGASYFVMEYLEGKALSELVEQGEHRLPLDRLTAIGCQVADGLEAAHAAGIVHRDLKPENLFLTQRKGKDFVKILDFGVARTLASDEEKLTLDGTILGTPHYMAPEQAQGSAVDARADIYSLGVILYELASGQLPFDGEHYMAVLTQHLLKAPPAFNELDPPAPVEPRLAEVIFRCLAKSPKDRYASMQEVRRALGNVRSDCYPMSTMPRQALDLAFTQGSHGIGIQGAAQASPRAKEGVFSEALAVPGDAERAQDLVVGSTPHGVGSARRPGGLALMGGVAVSILSVAVWFAVSGASPEEPEDAEVRAANSEQSPDHGTVTGVPATDSASQRTGSASPTPTVRVVEGASRPSSAQPASIEPVPAREGGTQTETEPKARAASSHAAPAASAPSMRKARTAVAPPAPQVKTKPRKPAARKPASTKPTGDGLLRPW